MFNVIYSMFLSLRLFQHRKLLKKHCNCLLLVLDRLLTQRLEDNIRKAKGLLLNKDEYNEIGLKCNCMPECTSMSYIIEISQSEWDWHRQYDFDYYNASVLK